MDVPLPSSGPAASAYTRSNAVCFDLLVLLDGVDAFIFVKGRSVDRWQLDGVALDQAVLVLDLAS